MKRKVFIHRLLSFVVLVVKYQDRCAEHGGWFAAMFTEALRRKMLK